VALPPSELPLREGHTKWLFDLDFAQVLDTDYHKLEALWMGYKIYDMLQDIDNPADALTVAVEQVAYQKTIKKENV